ncbi:uncharacterized protein LOC122224086 [Panthera leo]|uniref:uncharacterized protein LOC122224086 n=1 Tax=Panthera leo TaxID=9689 RepID=UPI001C6A7351|nr:uncharacterized protein LOC122224086 [Panthera leo]
MDHRTALGPLLTEISKKPYLRRSGALQARRLAAGRNRGQTRPGRGHAPAGTRRPEVRPPRLPPGAAGNSGWAAWRRRQVFRGSRCGRRAAPAFNRLCKEADWFCTRGTSCLPVIGSEDAPLVLAGRRSPAVSQCSPVAAEPQFPFGQPRVFAQSDTPSGRGPGCSRDPAFRHLEKRKHRAHQPVKLTASFEVYGMLALVSILPAFQFARKRQVHSGTVTPIPIKNTSGLPRGLGFLPPVVNSHLKAQNAARPGRPLPCCVHPGDANLAADKNIPGSRFLRAFLRLISDGS